MHTLSPVWLPRGWGFQNTLLQPPGTLQGLPQPPGDPPASGTPGGLPALRGGVAVLHDMAVTIADAVAGSYLGEASTGGEGALPGV